MNEIFGMTAVAALFIGGHLLKVYCRDTGSDLEEMDNPEPPARPLKPWGPNEREEAEATQQMEVYYQATHKDPFEQKMLEALRDR